MGFESNIAALEVRRPIISDRQPILDVLGQSLKLAIPPMVLEDRLLPDNLEAFSRGERTSHSPKREKRYEMYSGEWVLPIFQMTAPSSSRNFAALHKFAGDVSVVKSGKLSRSQTVIQEIPRKMAEISERFHNPATSHEVRGVIGSVAITNLLYKEGYELSLILMDGSRFFEESQAWVDAANANLALRSFAKPTSITVAKIGIARIFRNTTETEREKLVGTMKKNLPDLMPIKFGDVILPPKVHGRL